ncbi:UNVERIFIED_CONTAM: hypothetical protein Slati_0273100 [Sesamum latifolium]|uniref:Uncharacterized protein n=1 Tax=Sesamum latifolium TaxID=2727402 RepID=A0AAW2YDT9_9LAMI
MLNIEVSSAEFPASIGELFHLRYLNLDINPVYSHGNFQWTINTIEMIPNLKKLRVTYTDMSTGKWEKYGLNNLINLCQLEKLSISYITFNVASDPFPEGFAFPLKLKKLSLVGCRLPWQGLTVVGSLPYLEVLKLKSDSLVGRCWKSKQGEYPQLKYLLMQDLDIEYWQMEDTAFPTSSAP